MQKIESISEMRSVAAQLKSEGKSIALVPTMGALHAGQEALIRAAVARADVVIVAIFVNPLQFGPNEVIANYPRSFAEDLKLCETCGAQFVFAPSAEEMYPRGYSTYVTEDQTSRALCGPSRPTHFRGVTTMMAKFFNIIHPDFAFYGQKTAQRAAVVRKMAGDLHFGVELVVVPTVRESDGLAAGVRNREFTPSQRQEALALSKALRKVKEMADSGVRIPDRLIAEATHILSQHRRVRIIYISIVDNATMETMREVVPGRTMLAIAAWIDEVRLIDNVVL
ncbi:MAG TPA: pantoate--beta-alanine ligase [Opitutaceae bacterium]|nr:pantoate--beta-alanine ligase [Opitutaceae bacterium]HND62857.1 pantoate--beta-alanine ligase [Opitutaceae bacterium]